MSLAAIFLNAEHEVSGLGDFHTLNFKFQTGVWGKVVKNDLTK